MALIACRECKKDISDKAPACPHCGCPATAVTAPSVTHHAAAAPKTAPSAEPATKRSRWLAVVALLLGALWYFTSPTFNKQLKPDMPVQVKYRRALSGPGLVLVVENHSERQLSILASLKNPTLNNTHNFRFDISPGRATEAGYREGWTLSSGDLVVLSHRDYKDWRGTIP